MFYSKNLKKIKKLRHCFFSRKNGFSKGIYRSLNCGIGSNDKKNNIKKNIKIVISKLRTKSRQIFLVKQNLNTYFLLKN